VIPAIARISILQSFRRGIPHERKEFAWTPGTLTGKSTFSGDEFRKQCRYDCEVRSLPDENHWHGVAAGFSHIQMQAFHITLATAKLRRD
jgi:hypothetical protein